MELLYKNIKYWHVIPWIHEIRDLDRAPLGTLVLTIYGGHVISHSGPVEERSSGGFSWGTSSRLRPGGIL